MLALVIIQKKMITIFYKNGRKEVEERNVAISPSLQREISFTLIGNCLNSYNFIDGKWVHR